MGTFAIRDDLLRRVAKLAEISHAPLEEKLEELLLESVEWREASANLRSLMDSVAAMTPPVTQTDSVELLRQDRTR